MKILIIWLLLTSAAYSQITVPPESARDTIIEATVTATMPDGAVLDGGWKIPEGVDYRQVDANMIYMVAPPGEYLLRFSGFWLHLKDVTFKDGDGNEITITSYLGHGFIDEQAPFAVTGGVDPGPDPPQPAPIALDGLRVMIVRESGQPLTADQQLMINSTIWREAVGHGNWMVVDPDMIFRVPNPWQDAMDKTVNYGVPRVIVSNSSKGGFVGALPASLDALTSLIDDWAGDSGGGK